MRDGTVGAAGLDVYEEECEWFYEDRSDVTRQNKTLSLLVSMPNVIVTSHQAFLTHEALANIATTTLKNLDDYFAGAPLENEIISTPTSLAHRSKTKSATAASV